MVGRSESWVSRCEAGLSLPSERMTDSLATLYRLPVDEREQLVQMAAVAADKNWVIPGVAPEYAALILDEQAAQSIVNVQPNFIPGPLQTEAYTRAVMRGAGATSGQIDQGVELRQGRKEWLTSPKAPDLYVAFVGEQALRYPECDLSVMPDQLRHLLQVGKRPNVEILVIPLMAGYQKANEGRFVLMWLKNGTCVVHQEHLKSATALTDKDVETYKTAVVDIRRGALDKAASAAFMRELLKQMRKVTHAATKMA